jgi:hypothetical protein
MRTASWSFAIAATLFLVGCSSSSSTEADRHGIEGSSTLLNSKGKFDEDSARSDAIADVSALSFEDAGDTSDCIDDCSGHNAGFEWAKENAAGDPSVCSGNGDSFVEGCEAFSQAVENHVTKMREEWNAGEE